MATATKTKKNTKVDIRPLHDKIIVRRDEAEGITESGIYLPESSKERPKTGTIEAVGDGKLNTETGERTPSPSRRATRSSSPPTPAPRSPSATTNSSS